MKFYKTIMQRKGVFKMYIYCISNIINGKMYVGLSTKNVKESKNYYGSGIAIGHAIKKYGKENFNKEILEICNTDGQLKKREIFWIKEMNTKAPNGYNLTDGGDGVLNPTKHTLKLRSDKMKLLVGEKSPQWGMKRSDETKLKMRNAQLGVPMTQSAKDKLSKSITGRKLSKETCKKMSEYRMGKPISKKIIDKIRKNQPSCTPILQIDKITNELITEYFSMQEASRQTGVPAGNICKCCKGELKSAGKFIWKYLETI